MQHAILRSAWPATYRRILQTRRTARPQVRAGPAKLPRTAGLPGTPQFQTLPSSYTIVYGFDQYVTTYGPPTKLGHSPGWGVFGRAGIADGATGNPNFSAWHVSAGIGGESPLRARRDKGDRFGIGYGYTGISTESGAIPQALFGPRDGQVFEAYYSWQATPAIAVSPDFQWIRGSLSRQTEGNDAFVFGMRLNVRL
ncbi:MAG: carbohydrate porin [Planctomycetales bacterium]